MPAKRAAYHDKSEPVQNRLFRSLRVWSMYADLEESLGSFEVRGRGRQGGGVKGRGVFMGREEGERYRRP